jgi:predicted CXXCH cytochrome family protein
VGQPTGTSRLCLSCHDGTIAPGAVLSQTTEMPMTTTLAGRSSNLGTNLSDDHPVSFVYDDAALAVDSQLVAGAALPSAVRLDRSGQLQCTACHDPHNDQYGKFLVLSNLRSALCTGCHAKTNWSSGSHATSTNIWNGAAPDPWPNSSYTTVADNACGNCHRPHNAPGVQRLQTSNVEEATCLVCHNGNVAAKDRTVDLAKPYRHPVGSFTGVHDAAERYSGLVSKHVECVDCHNPHQANSTVVAAPQVPGRLQGVSGVDLYTNAHLPSAAYEYQVCFKCHGDLSNNVLASVPQPITRYWTNTRDNRVKFGGVSYHPVIQPLNKISDSLLVAPYYKGMMLYCTDCHGSDTGTMRGSHGSIYEFILVARLETSEVLPTSPTAYLTDNALCFKCHSATALFGTTTKFPQHKKHLTDQHMERCSYCHDPHGSPVNPGMINFDMRPGIVSLSNGKPITLRYPLSTKTTCVLVCHGVVHGS